MKGTVLWNEKMSVGVRQFDEHHKKIIDLIHNLSAAKQEGMSREEIYSVISELSSYVHYHFIAEERMMRVYHYPDTINHIREHRFFTGRIEHFAKSYSSGSEGIQDEILDFLKDWFIKHIIGSDMKYGMFLSKQGVV